MACSYFYNDIPEFLAVKALAAVEQPRPTVKQPSRRALPHAEPHHQSQSSLLETLPFDCRVLIWKHALQTPYTRIERWRPPNDTSFGMEELDADCFPYRTSTPDMKKHENKEKQDKPLALLLSCRRV
jgi:hypothetical protein